mmetsp:Transcript_14704/g.40651  ORF Transcript_14704/g.40651 Transcript_14704/m.40651 type:complete len:330 (-) Transcript_14704:1389-2378(-)|eukprot:CAMPEP_0198135266 /NCGR_PEP_ID=MMETSP1442-20131203/60492_1 /TAXON_ID= /ORGANISM="Craspedostauros australis, Strain CCMP3328" /LENGTH=329 /DNA_ID=CAMNT_0043796429 /DNA_START=86 /DNA_END=1075 /DNA_ORIENTATION=+
MVKRNNPNASIISSSIVGSSMDSPKLSNPQTATASESALFQTISDKNAAVNAAVNASISPNISHHGSHHGSHHSSNNGKQKTTQQRRRANILQPLDDFLAKLVRFFATSSGKERTMKLVQYMLWFLSHYYCSGQTRTSLENLSGEVLWARYVLRFFGWPSAIQAARTNCWAPGRIGRLLAWSMVAYFPLEHAAYLHWKAPQLMRSSRPSQVANTLSAWSCRFWMVYIMVDTYRALRSLQDLQRVQQQQQFNDASSPLDSSHDYDDHGTAIQIQNERIGLLRNFLSCVPAYHWSFDTGESGVSNVTVKGMMLTDAVVGFYQEVRNFMRKQ